MKTIYDFSVKDRKGGLVSLKEYANEVILIVNTATKCGFTPQYDELEALYEKYHSQGFTILDFPCNQFGQQAPGTDESIHEFCKLNFGTEFPRFKKIKVNGVILSTNSFRSRRVLQAGIWSILSLTSSTTCFQRLIPITSRSPTSSGTLPNSLSTRRDRWLHASNLQRK